MISAQLVERVQQWLAQEVSDHDTAELQDLLATEAAAELDDRFAAALSFGTAGLRGPLRAGPNGMNAAVVRRAAAGIACWLAGRGTTGARVVIGHDARYRSEEFARDSAAVLAAAGFRPEVLAGPQPTPVLAFAVRHRNAVAGIMVTASHNPATDNGYKVYLGADARVHPDAAAAQVGAGAQIVAPIDQEIEAMIAAVGAADAIALSTEYNVLAGAVLDDVVGQYVDATVSAVFAAAGAGQDRGTGHADLTIVHTALHGVGWPVVRRVFEAAGFTGLIPTSSQQEPDPDFPTVAFPNPEEPGALAAALELARESGADLVIANDPDADRCALAVPVADGSWRSLTGDEVGVLLADALLSPDPARPSVPGPPGTYATTIVSSTLLGRMVNARGARYLETLTGFKWIMRAAPDLVFGYEEALGYAVAPQLVRDKDGISAALLAAVVTWRLLASGSSPAARLDQLATEFGVHATEGRSIRVDDLAKIASMMTGLRIHPPTMLAGQPVATDDLLPLTDALRLIWKNGRAVVRPSGTEPKLKIYLEVRHQVATDGVAPARRQAGHMLRAVGDELVNRLQATTKLRGDELSGGRIAGPPHHRAQEQ